ncbi:uncharacterized protein LY79DRAFT_183907 [Colletotrichum navitas]|uniref:Uncharacterized protein n=1 Tax=Colletotrichum navitas TaxID=681940 RepID=A0AAD8V3V1_9PEZI|nr:uncharacterized protein LY79DRAFT_183907 [Colletotrichum navitas]KAK1593312.1 hypothetical protein LY79DRAFT_183907 [Colletotrichum navitas]
MPPLALRISAPNRGFTPSTRRHDRQGLVTVGFPMLLFLAVTPVAWHCVSNGADPSNVPEGVAGPMAESIQPKKGWTRRDVCQGPHRSMGRQAGETRTRLQSTASQREIHFAGVRQISARPNYGVRMILLSFNVASRDSPPVNPSPYRVAFSEGKSLPKLRLKTPEILIVWIR